MDTPAPSISRSPPGGRRRGAIAAGTLLALLLVAATTLLVARATYRPLRWGGSTGGGSWGTSVHGHLYLALRRGPFTIDTSVSEQLSDPERWRALTSGSPVPVRTDWGGVDVAVEATAQRLATRAVPDDPLGAARTACAQGLAVGLWHLPLRTLFRKPLRAGGGGDPAPPGHREVVEGGLALVP